MGSSVLDPYGSRARRGKQPNAKKARHGEERFIAQKTCDATPHLAAQTPLGMTGFEGPPRLAVAGLLVLFGGGGDTHAAEFIGIVLAEEEIPLLTAFDDFLFLGSDALADFGFDLFFFAQDVGDGLDDVLADGVAVFDELDFIALHEKIGDLMGDADDFFAAQSHRVCRPQFPSLAATSSGERCKAESSAGVQRKINFWSRAIWPFTFLNIS